MDLKPAESIFGTSTALHTTASRFTNDQRKTINPITVQPASYMNDAMSSRQHEPNQVTEFSQQPSPQHAYQETAYQNLSAAIASPNVTHTQEAVRPTSATSRRFQRSSGNQIQ